MNARIRRSRHDIIMEILKTAVDGEVKTHIMYKAGLSFVQLNNYLEQLNKMGLLKKFKVNGNKLSNVVYKTTEKGLEFIETFENVERLCKN